MSPTVPLVAGICLHPLDIFHVFWQTKVRPRFVNSRQCFLVLSSCQVSSLASVSPIPPPPSPPSVHRCPIPFDSASFNRFPWHGQNRWYTIGEYCPSTMDLRAGHRHVGRIFGLEQKRTSQGRRLHGNGRSSYGQGRSQGERRSSQNARNKIPIPRDASSRDAEPAVAGRHVDTRIQARRYCRFKMRMGVSEAHDTRGQACF